MSSLRTRLGRLNGAGPAGAGPPASVPLVGSAAVNVLSRPRNVLVPDPPPSLRPAQPESARTEGAVSNASPNVGETVAGDVASAPPLRVEPALGADGERNAAHAPEGSREPAHVSELAERLAAALAAHGVGLASSSSERPSASSSESPLLRKLRGISVRRLTEGATPAAPSTGPAPTPEPDARARPGTFSLEVRETRSGPLSCIERWFDADHRHGRVPVSAALRVPSNTVAALSLDETFRDVDLNRMLFVDTETTGLAGGAGTLPFLIGLSWFENGRLRMEQLFLPRPGAERAMLARLAERIAEASCIVTYNGKSYDVPLLKTRFIMNRLRAPTMPPHLDLVHASRRLYRKRLQEFRLGSIENSVLGFVRHGDIPGALIPERYFAFLRGRPLSTLQPIFEHNESDLAALAATLASMGALYAATGDGEHEHPGEDLVCAALVALRAGELDAAELLATRTLGTVRKERGLRYEAHVVMGRARLLKGDARAAADSFLAALEEQPRHAAAAEIHLTLAKLCEHQLRDWAKARHHAQLSVGAETSESNLRRLERLDRRAELSLRRRTKSPTPLLDRVSS